MTGSSVRNSSDTIWVLGIKSRPWVSLFFLPSTPSLDINRGSGTGTFATKQQPKLTQAGLGFVFFFPENHVTRGRVHLLPSLPAAVF